MTEQANAIGSREPAKDADLDFGGLAVGVSCGDTFAKGPEAAHLRLDPASGMVSGPAFPERPAVVPCGTQGFVSGLRCRAVFLPRSVVLADRDDRNGLAVDDGGPGSAIRALPLPPEPEQLSPVFLAQQIIFRFPKLDPTMPLYFYNLTPIFWHL